MKGVRGMASALSNKITNQRDQQRRVHAVDVQKLKQGGESEKTGGVRTITSCDSGLVGPTCEAYNRSLHPYVPDPFLRPTTPNTTTQFPTSLTSPHPLREKSQPIGSRIRKTQEHTVFWIMDTL